jgi:hypothetical protein
MMMRAIHVAMAIGVMGLAADSVQGAVRGQDDVGPEIRVINNYTSSVQVYVEDAQGKLHALGRVRHSDLKVLVVPQEIARRGEFRVKVFPSAPLWAATSYGKGIRTGDLSLEEHDTVNFWVEPDLTASIVEVMRH